MNSKWVIVLACACFTVSNGVSVPPTATAVTSGDENDTTSAVQTVAGTATDEHSTSTKPSQPTTTKPSQPTTTPATTAQETTTREVNSPTTSKGALSTTRRMHTTDPGNQPSTATTSINLLSELTNSLANSSFVRQLGNILTGLISSLNGNQSTSGGSPTAGPGGNDLSQSPGLGNQTGGTSNNNPINGGTNFDIQTLLSGLLGQSGTSGLLSQIPPGLWSLTGVLTLMSTGRSNEVYADVDQALAKAGVNVDCREDVILMIEGLTETKDWALKAVDSMGKIGSNILSGRTKFPGSFDECVSINANVYNSYRKKDDAFVGKFCRVAIPTPLETLIFGTCVSSKCYADDINIVVREAAKFLTSSQEAPDIEVSCVEDRKFGTDAIICTVTLAILVFFVFIGTLYDVLAVQMSRNQSNSTPGNQTKAHTYVVNGDKNQLYTPNVFANKGYVVSDEEKVTYETKLNGIEVDAVHIKPTTDSAQTEKQSSQNVEKTRGMVENILLAFSVYSNGVKILNTDQGAGTLGALNGVRFLSMAWVILGHTFFFAMGFDANLYTYFLQKLNDHWTFLAIAYATVSVDSFFAISGILVGYLTLREIGKLGGAKNLNWFMFYFHRFWRLTPAYMLVIMVGTVLLPYAISGAMEPDGDVPYMGDCRKLWWTNVLYVNNFVLDDGMCMGWTWYLADDMQYYILSPLILLPLFYNVFAGVASCLVFLVATTVTAGIIANKHEYPIQMFTDLAPQPTDPDYQKNLYFPSYVRMGPYIIGLFTGYMLYRTKCKARMPKILNIVVWFLSLSICVTVIYSLYTDGDSHLLTVKESAAFHALHRTAWGMSICWFVFACATGYGGWINELLSWKGFVPLGRLTYSAYLIHPLIMIVFYASRPHLTEFTRFEFIYLFLGHMCMSYGIGFIVSLLFESPMMGLEKAIFKRGKK